MFTLLPILKIDEKINIYDILCLRTTPITNKQMSLQCEYMANSLVKMGKVDNRKTTRDSISNRRLRRTIDISMH